MPCPGSICKIYDVCNVRLGRGEPLCSSDNKVAAPSASDNSDYAAAVRRTIDDWSFDIGIAEFIDDKGVVDLMQRLNTLKSAYGA
jgi:hypothetical protein